MLFEDPEFDIVKRYSNIFKLIFLVGFYASILPMGLPFAFLGIIFEYYTDKVIIFLNINKYTMNFKKIV